MVGWTVEEKPAGTGSGAKVYGGKLVYTERPKIVMISPDKRMKVTIELTEQTHPTWAAKLSNSMQRLVRGDVTLALGILLQMMNELYEIVHREYPADGD